MKICVSAPIMHFPIKEIASRAKNICCWNDFKLNIEHVRCQLGAIKYTVIQSKYTSQPSSINATEKNFCMCGGFGRKGRMLPLEISLKSHRDSLPADVRWGSVVTHSFLPLGRDGCSPSLLISVSGSRSQREELLLSRSLFFIKNSLTRASRSRKILSSTCGQV